MRFGAVTFIWTSPLDTAALGVVQTIADVGFDVAEIAVEEVGKLDHGALREALAVSGLGASVIGFGATGRDLSSGDDAERAAGLAYVRACVDVAAATAAEVVCGPLHTAVGKARVLEPAERAAERDRAIAGLREVGDYAGSRNVTLAIEPLNRFEEDILNTVERGLDLCAAVDLDSVGLLLDTFHMNVEEKDVSAAIREAGDRLVHFHASENDRGTLGTGHVDWGEVRGGLAGAEYEGIITVESFVPHVPGLATAVSMWRPFFSDPHDFARRSLEHLRATFPKEI